MLRLERDVVDLTAAAAAPIVAEQSMLRASEWVVSGACEQAKARGVRLGSVTGLLDPPIF